MTATVRNMHSSRKRATDDSVRGQVIYLLNSGVTVVPIDPRPDTLTARAGWDCVVLRQNGRIGAVVHIDAHSIAAGLPVPLPRPQLNLTDLIAAWIARVYRTWPTEAGHQHLAQILGTQALRISDPTIHLNSRAVRDIALQIDQARVVTVRAMLDHFMQAELLVADENRYRIQLP